MLRKNVYSLFVGIILLLSLGSCVQKKKKELQGQDVALQEHWGRNIIVPAFKNYQKEIASLHKAAQSFEKEKTEEKLDVLKKAWLSGYEALQRIIIFDFGFAQKSYLIPLSNTYPCDTKAIERNILLVEQGKEADISLKPTAAVVQYVYQGFPALDYLLFEKTHDLAYYQSDKGASAAKYMTLLTAFLQKMINELVTHWDSYLVDYTKDTDPSATGAYASTINGFVRAYEKNIRAEKVGYAAGAIPAQKGKAAPEVIEAYYNGAIDKHLLMIAVQTSQDFFNGKAFEGGTEGESLASVLKKMKQEKLVEKINQQYKVIIETIQAMPLSLKETAVQDNTKMIVLYQSLQKNVAYYKTYMLTALSVAVNYQDTDGD